MGNNKSIITNDSCTVPPNNKKRNIKISIVGDSICRLGYLINDIYHHYPSVGFPSQPKKTLRKLRAWKELNIQVELTDVLGIENWVVNRITYHEVDLFIVSYLSSSSESLENVVNKWVPEIRQENSNGLIVLLAIESSKSPSIVSIDDAYNVAKEIGAIRLLKIDELCTTQQTTKLMEISVRLSTAARSKDFQGLDESDLKKMKESILDNDYLSIKNGVNSIFAQDMLSSFNKHPSKPSLKKPYGRSSIRSSYKGQEDCSDHSIM